MSNNGAVIRFNDVIFQYVDFRPILNEVSFSIRRGAKLTIMGQNGAGKSTLFKLITGELKPEDGSINIDQKATVAISRQVIPRDQLDFTVKEFFQAVFSETVYNIDPRIDKALEIVNFSADHDKKINEFSGGQQARLLLASALIQEPDILLLDEPTNNLDTAGIDHLTDFLKSYNKTVLVISHDADFLNSFTEGVLYLDVRTQKIEQYTGNYFKVVKEIERHIAKQKSLNARLKKEIIAKKEKANFFANKGGRLRAVAKEMRETAAEAEESMVDVRKEDKTIRKFEIPIPDELMGNIITITSFSRLKDGKVSEKKANIEMKKGDRLQLVGPNGIGKTTLLENMANSRAEGAKILESIRVGYYRQDFSMLDFNHSVRESLLEAMVGEKNEEVMRSIASGFLIDGNLIKERIANISEGQKGLVAFARLVLMRPGLLIMDEPTNHINFRHLPVIAKALDEYKGALIVVSHDKEFIEQIHIENKLDLGK